MENTGDTVPSIPDLQTAPIKSYQSKLTALLQTDSVDDFLESLTEYARPRTHHQRWRSWSFLVVNFPPGL
jgi:hypothetical protein